MKRLITAALAASIAVPMIAVPMASAQSPGEIRRDQRDLREEQRDLQDARRHGGPDDVRDERRDVREARQELREDWRDYRQTNGERFRRPPYVGPRGFKYRQFAVGNRLSPQYLAGRYRIGSYATYRLPPPQPGTAWVRYSNDVLLVNLRTGRIITVYHGFFL